VGELDYVELVERVLVGVLDAMGDDFEVQLTGVVDDDVQAGLGEPVDDGAFRCAIEDLEGMYLIDRDAMQLKPTALAQEVRDAGLSALWLQFFNRRLSGPQADFLNALVEICAPSSGLPSPILDASVDELVAKLGSGWEAGSAKVFSVFGALQEAGLARGGTAGGGMIWGLRPSYGGIVRATRQEPTESRALVAGLLPEGETTTVEIKRQIDLTSPTGKAEFAKDICALATTKASGARRYLLIGFDDKTRAFVQSVDPGITQNRIEQILNGQTQSAPNVRFLRVPWENGEAGLLVVLREPPTIPYRLTAATAARFRGEEVWVRHGSQVEPPTTAELAALIAEGDAARAGAP